MFVIKKHLVYNKCLFGGLFMHENNWQVDLSNISSEFNNETMRYRINGFAYSCGMNDIDVISNAGVLSKNKENGEHRILHLSVSRHHCGGDYREEGGQLHHQKRGAGRGDGAVGIYLL